jgi:hypothetical protein
MKLNLPTVEETDRINYRIPVSIKAELDELADRCKKAKLDFNAALFEGLRSIVKAIRQELDDQTSRGAKSGASVAPAANQTEHSAVTARIPEMRNGITTRDV